MSADSGAGWSRRQMIAAGTTGLVAASSGSTGTGPARAAGRGRPEAPDGTPEQVHLTWGDDPTRTVVVSWASPGQAERPRVRIGQRVITAAERACTDTLSGAVTWTYHARVDGLRPGATYGYAVTADNDANAADPFSATFTTAPEGRAAFRFTSFGDLAAPHPAWATYAVGAVEAFQPLFHLLNGDLADACPHPGPVNTGVLNTGVLNTGVLNTGVLNTGVLNTGAQAQAWRDFGNNVQASAANRPWLPVHGNHVLGPGDGEQRRASYLIRYTLPSNGADDLEGPWYAFRVGTALFVCLSGDDVAFQGVTAAGPAPLRPEPPVSEPPTPEPPTGAPATAEGTPRSARGYSGGTQTRWLESTLAAARADASIDWIVVQLHQCACSSAPFGGGSDLGVRQEWLPLFDNYEVDLVLSGHDYGYERSFPVRGFDGDAGTDTLTGAVTDTRRPRPVTTVDSGVFDTSQGTVHLMLGCGGSQASPAGPEDGQPGASPPMARVFTRPAIPVPDQRVPGGYARPAADTVEAATWSARRDTSSGYGIAVFDVSPGSEAGGQTSITVRYYHAAGQDAGGTEQAGTGTSPLGPPNGDYTLYETFTVVRPRSDGRRWHPKG